MTVAGESYRQYEVVIDLLEGYVSNPKRAAGEYAALQPQAEQILHCGYPDLESRAATVIDLIQRAEARAAKKPWQFWKR